MARIVTPLTVTKINAAKPKEKLYKLTDGAGLALWILPSGKKTWRFEYRRSDKKLDTITFGSYRLCCINRHCQASLCIIPHDKRLQSKIQYN